MRDPPPRTAGGISIPPKMKCFCGHRVAAEKLLRIPHTGIVANVVSMVCRDCPNKAREEVLKTFAIVCVGCREVVEYRVPYKEPRSGFSWEAGKCYHVPRCPSCVGRFFESSPVIEQKAFYLAHGLPYKDSGADEALQNV